MTARATLVDGVAAECSRCGEARSAPWCDKGWRIVLDWWRGQERVEARVIEVLIFAIYGAALVLTMGWALPNSTALLYALAATFLTVLSDAMRSLMTEPPVPASTVRHLLAVLKGKIQGEHSPRA